jgi:hypothetical protein
LWTNLTNITSGPDFPANINVSGITTSGECTNIDSASYNSSGGLAVFHLLFGIPSEPYYLTMTLTNLCDSAGSLTNSITLYLYPSGAISSGNEVNYYLNPDKTISQSCNYSYSVSGSAFVETGYSLYTYKGNAAFSLSSGLKRAFPADKTMEINGNLRLFK